MATATADVRNTRVVVLVSEREKRRISDSARAADMSVSDFMRTAAEGYSEPSEVERALMIDLLDQLEAANLRTDAALERLERAQAFDEDAYRATIVQRLEARTDIDWSALGATLALGRAGA